ncbi:MAG: Kelch repeat-containing protein [Gaiellaceae bacterium]
MIAELLALAATWQTGPALPLARSEVASAAWRGRVVVAGGYLPDGRSSSRVDLYDRRARRWSRLPDLPLPVNHAMAAAGNGRLYVVGGYGAERAAFVLNAGTWRRLPSLPLPRAAAGAAVIGRTLYVAGGVGPAGVAKSMLAYDIARRRWRTLGGPVAREHLGVTALGGRLYAIAGRVNGQRFSIVQRWSPRTRSWERLAPVPEPRGGTGAAAAAGQIVSAGDESGAGTSAAVYAYTPATNRWRRLPDLPTARHGLAVVAIGSTVHVIGGGPTPGLSVSDANESFDLGAD